MAKELIDKFKEYSHSTDFDESECQIYPTHWMPLPQPPQK